MHEDPDAPPFLQREDPHRDLEQVCYRNLEQVVFVRREVFEALGGYPEMPLMEDVELCRRLKRRGRLAALRPRVTTAARKWEREGALRTIVLMWVLRFLYMAGVPPARLHRWYYRREP